MSSNICKFFGKCGGCSCQHIIYSLQLENKRKVLERAVKFKDIRVVSGKKIHYRNRMDMIFHPKGLGFREKGKWYKIIDVDKCLIADARINKIAKEIKGFFKEADTFDIKKQIGTYKFAVIRTPKNDSSVSFTLNADSTRINKAIEKINDFAKITSAKNIIVTYVPHNSDMSTSDDYFVVKGKDMIKEDYFKQSFLFSVQGFFQNNTNMAEEMHHYCKLLLKQYETEDSHLLDLYGGVGTFGIINADLFKDVTIIEEFKGSIDAANLNIEANEIRNAKAIALDAKKLRTVKFPEDLIVVTDPPRSGMHPKTIKQLNDLKPKVIIYVSCNVKQLASELPQFKNYKIKSAALFDLFPHTSHSEAVVELVLKE